MTQKQFVFQFSDRIPNGQTCQLQEYRELRVASSLWRLSMSTLAVDNFKPSAGGTAFGLSGIAKTHVNLNGTGTIAVVGSSNVASITDNGTGRYTTTLTSAMSATTYTAIGSGGSSSTGNINGGIRIGDNTTSTKTTSALTIVATSGGDVAVVDQDRLHVMWLGDLA